MEKVALAKEIVNMFVILRDNNTSNGYETFFDPTAHCGYIENYIRSKRSRDPEITTAWTHRKKLAVIVTTSDDDERMLREIRQNSSNASELLKLMDQTRATRRTWISDDHSTITAVLKRHPRFQDMNNAIREEFAAIIPEEARTTKLRVEWRKLRDNLLEVAKSRTYGREDLRELLSDVNNNDYDEEHITEVSLRVVTHLLPVPPQNGKKQPRLSPQAVEEMLFFEVTDEVAVDTVVKKLTSTQPVLFRCQGRLWVKVDCSAIELTDASCFADAVEMLIAIFFVFDVEHPYHLKPTYELLDTVLNLRKTPQAAVAKELLRSVRCL